MNHYRAGDFRAPQDEVERLAAQAAAIAARELTALDRLGLPARGRALDVGCGPGFFARGLQQHRPDLQIAGVDIDAYVLPRAQAALPVVRGDVAALPFADGSFDLVYARLFLRHLRDPLAALRSMTRLTCAGGWVAAIDCADSSLNLRPLPAGFAAVAAARERWFRERGCSGDLGQHLPELLLAAGLRQLRVGSVQFDTSWLGAPAFAHIVLGPFLEAASQVLPPGALVPAARAAVDRWIAEPASFGSFTLFVVAGQREPAPA